MRGWINHPNSRISRQRFYTQHFILILGNSGIRCGTECRSLKWSDISTTKDMMGDERVVISVKGKTDRRDVICNVGIENYFKRLYEFRTKELGHPPPPSESVLVNPNGKPIQSKGSFNSLMDEVGLSFDDEGKEEPLLNSSYLHNDEVDGKVNIYQLSSNVGTSEMIENYYGHLHNRDPMSSQRLQRTHSPRPKTIQIGFPKT